MSFPPLGMLPSFDVIDRNTTTSVLGFKDHYEMNKWLLMGEGDILLLHTDGLTEHVSGGEAYVPAASSRPSASPIAGRLATFSRPSRRICWPSRRT